MTTHSSAEAGKADLVRWCRYMWAAYEYEDEPPPCDDDLIETVFDDEHLGGDYNYFLADTVLNVPWNPPQDDDEGV